MSNEINILELINVMLRKWWLIVIVSIISAAGTYIYTDLFIEPTFKSDGAIYVNCETQTSKVEDVASVGRLESSYRLATTYVEVLKRRTFLTDVARDLNNRYSYNQISGMLTIEPVNETELLEITVRGTNAQDVNDIVESILNRAGDQLVSVVKAGSVEIVDKPFVSNIPVSPNKSRNSLLGFIAGMVLSMGVIFIIELFDTHVKTADEMKSKYSEPVLGEIPSLSAQ